MMDEQETPHPDYVTGFNEGYIIAQHEPGIAKEFAKATPVSERLQGFKDGHNLAAREKSLDQRPAWLKSGRLSSLDQSSANTKDREKDEPNRE